MRQTLREEPMPRYYFHLHNGATARDEEGRELPDLETARQEAIKAARELMGEDIKQGRLQLGHRIEIRDAEGSEALIVQFREAVTIET
jgi:hypothetical protein